MGQLSSTETLSCTALAQCPYQYQVSDWLIDPRQRCIYKPGHKQTLPAQKMAVLWTLLEAENGVVTREMLTATVWRGNPYTASKGINNAIWYLRQRLDQETFSIATIRQVGYQLQTTQPIRRVHSDARQASSHITRLMVSTLIGAVGLLGLGWLMHLIVV
ncbi:MAG: hypothetical protein Tsb002_01270 [Wenzhouxiangellaceae bacterium]